jgi:hypothetical protein
MMISFRCRLTRDCGSDENPRQTADARGKRKTGKIVCLFAPIGKKQRSVTGFLLGQKSPQTLRGFRFPCPRSVRL